MLEKAAQLAGVGVVAGVLVGALALPFVGAAGITARNAANGFQNLPSDLRTPPLAQRSRILDSDGRVVATFFDENREVVSLKEIAPVMRQALIAIEDARFYQHGGLDLKGTMRAALSTAGGAQQGGSTLTQQYVKNVLVESAETKEEIEAARAPTLARKLKELRYALTIEKKLRKNEILERYLNIAYFGDGAYGVQSAARHYFDTTAKKLTLAQSATLAAIVRNPGYDPRRFPKEVLQRRNLVLQRLADTGKLPKAAADKAKKEELGLDVTRTKNGCHYSKYPFFCDYVVSEIRTNPIFGKTAKEREKLLKRGGLTIRTTLDVKAQKAADRALRAQISSQDYEVGAQAMVEPGTGRIKALAVSREYGEDKSRRQTQINFAADQKHGGNLGMQAGSTFKAFVLAAALDKNIPYGERIMAPHREPYTGFTNCDGENVSDYGASAANAADGEGGKAFSVLTGTHHSVNTFFIRLERKVGLCESVEMAEKLGVRRSTGQRLSQIPSFVLGVDPVSPLQMAAAYATFAARGEYCKPIAITEMLSHDGKKMKIPRPNCDKVIDEDVADAVNYALSGVINKGGTGAGLSPGFPAAGKTGTTDDYGNAWFAGYSPKLASAVALGDERGAAQHKLRNVTIGGRYYGQVFGATISGKIWQASMRGALAGERNPGFNRPSGKYFRGLKRESDDDKEGNTVPAVAGQDIMSAMTELRRAGFNPRSAGQVSSPVPAGRVARTSPDAGSRLRKGSTVLVYMSGGDGDNGGGGGGGRWPPPRPRD
ncbi:MAG: PASTA domain-containing protein [Streptosporangiales bacterium]|nr:PASTA domain-containing protein [Streptosporangiales bacterium]